MRLQLSRRADYAVRAVLALTELEGIVPMHSLAERMGIPPSFLPQILPRLVRSGILLRRLGRDGGYVLARPAARISLLDVIEASEPQARPASCVLRDGGCRASEPCRVHPAVVKARDALRCSLAESDFESLRDGRTLASS